MVFFIRVTWAAWCSRCTPPVYVQQAAAAAAAQARLHQATVVGLKYIILYPSVSVNSSATLISLPGPLATIKCQGLAARCMYVGARHGGWWGIGDEIQSPGDWGAAGEHAHQ